MKNEALICTAPHRTCWRYRVLCPKAGAELLREPQQGRKGVHCARHGLAILPRRFRQILSAAAAVAAMEEKDEIGRASTYLRTFVAIL